MVAFLCLIYCNILYIIIKMYFGLVVMSGTLVGLMYEFLITLFQPHVTHHTILHFHLLERCSVFDRVVFQLAGDRPMPPNHERYTILLCFQLPTNFHNFKIVQGALVSGASSSRTFYGTQWCLVTCACTMHSIVHERVGSRQG